MLKKFAFLSGSAILFFQPLVQAVAPTDCCCSSCMCPAGTTGPQGPLGATGNAGPLGLQGAIGPQGAPGTQGVAGPVGPCCPTTVGSQFANVYSNMFQSLAASGAMNAAGGAVLLELSSPGTTSLIDTSSAGTTGEISVNGTGVYRVFYSVQASTTTPANGEALAVSLFLDDVIVSGSTASTLLVMPAGVIGYNITGEVYVSITAGQKLKLASSSAMTMTLISSSTGSTSPVNSASLDILLIEAL